MKWSFRVARVAGIDVNVHATFGLIVALGAFQWSAHHGGRGALFGVALTLALFACVAMHELGHSLVARRFGLAVREIVLLPIGGVAMLTGRPKKPLHELLIALAGPAVNVVLAAVLLIVSASFGLLSGLPAIGPDAVPSLGTAVVWLLGANVALAVFNMIPALPLDGGRVLRAGLAMAIGPARATAAAASIGQAIAVLLFAGAVLSGHLVLALISVFVFLGATQERTAERATSILGGVPVGRAYNRRAIVLSPCDRVSDAAEHILTTYQTDFAVLLDAAPIGVLTRADVVRALAGGGGNAYVAGIMRRDVVRVDADRSLDEVLRLMSEKNTPVVAVYDGERYLGLVSQDDIAEALTLLQFLPTSTRHGTASPAARRAEDMM
ncbi:protease [Sorangium cellulosum]|uniref:Zinc metalloprotease n=1 Tax=Sorangium cellulosum TaxID=56 RepID=A0A2L0EQ47_SORCE|nr:site-2 protease family protein [Sorangium cellulosum]AUX41416.1 protease [Sorangium cellulosum]